MKTTFLNDLRNFWSIFLETVRHFELVLTLQLGTVNFQEIGILFCINHKNFSAVLRRKYTKLYRLRSKVNSECVTTVSLASSGGETRRVVPRAAPTASFQ